MPLRRDRVPQCREELHGRLAESAPRLMRQGRELLSACIVCVFLALLLVALLSCATIRGRTRAQAREARVGRARHRRMGDGDVQGGDGLEDGEDVTTGVRVLQASTRREEQVKRRFH